jgi:hypothetical protein
MTEPLSIRRICFWTISSLKYGTRVARSRVSNPTGDIPADSSATALHLSQVTISRDAVYRWPRAKRKEGADRAPSCCYSTPDAYSGIGERISVTKVASINL